MQLYTIDLIAYCTCHCDAKTKTRLLGNVNIKDGGVAGQCARGVLLFLSFPFRQMGGEHYTRI